MALGIFTANSRITTDTDTTVIAAPSSNAGKPERINIRSITVDVETAGSGSKLRLEDGVGGNVLATLDTGDDNNRLERVYHTDPPFKGYPLSTNTALNAETTSSTGVVVINVEYEVTGG